MQKVGVNKLIKASRRCVMVLFFLPREMVCVCVCECEFKKERSNAWTEFFQTLHRSYLGISISVFWSWSIGCGGLGIKTLAVKNACCTCVYLLNAEPCLPAEGSKMFLDVFSLDIFRTLTCTHKFSFCILSSLSLRVWWEWPNWQVIKFFWSFWFNGVCISPHPPEITFWWKLI